MWLVIDGEFLKFECVLLDLHLIIGLVFLLIVGAGVVIIQSIL